MGRFTTSLITAITFLASIVCAIYSAYGLQSLYPELCNALDLLPRALYELGDFLECSMSLYVNFLCFFGLTSSVLCLFGIHTQKAKLIRLFSAYWATIGASTMAVAVGISYNLYQRGGELEYDYVNTYLNAFNSVNMALFSGHLCLAARATAKNVEEKQFKLPFDAFKF
ncbi:hypothetical protein L596_025300 [Steinernema carpocapsae]|uniref:Uncharacterized protein n=1 Tax=Steinernema carpocapsae TaxID=34508 RepID=A0A4U5M7D4_STECR|nr:hypothetical protein L596_025300 [Steinernema carpocapsae]